MIRRLAGARVVFVALAILFAACAPSTRAQTGLPAPALRAPVWVYNNSSASAGMAGKGVLDEARAMRELDELLRLKKAGLRFDYSMMGAFWFAPDGGYRTWRKKEWPNGPDAWIARCEQNGIQPGLWFGTNTLGKIEAAPAWRNSLDRDGTAMSLFEGGFLPDFMNVLQYWYDRGIRMFQLDDVDLTAATPASAARLSQEQIEERNAEALRNALLAFRRRNPEALLVAFNSVGGGVNAAADEPPSRDPGGTQFDLRWLGVVQMESTGDPRRSDVPEANFWRSMDIYSDRLVRRLEQWGVPLERIDSTGFTAGETDAGYERGLHAWKGAWLLTMARGGWVNTVDGDLERIQGRDAQWMARAQRLFFELQALGRIHSFGGMPGEGAPGEMEPYGFGGVTTRGAVYVVMNPGQTVATLTLPRLAPNQPVPGKGRVQFRDAGFVPRLSGDSITLGPGQMAMVGYGAYAAPSYSFGVQGDVVIPSSIEPVPADFETVAPGMIEAQIHPPLRGVLRIVLRQRTPDGQVPQGWAGDPPLDNPLSGKSPNGILQIEATQFNRPIPIRIDSDGTEWSGLSWAVGEMDVYDLTPGVPVVVRIHSNQPGPVELEGSAYQVVY